MKSGAAVKAGRSKALADNPMADSALDPLVLAQEGFGDSARKPPARMFVEMALESVLRRPARSAIGVGVHAAGHRAIPS